MKTLEQILKETAKAKNDGEFGITACKESIKFALEYTQGTCDTEKLYRLLYTYVDRANNTVWFNENMVQACWQLINER